MTDAQVLDEMRRDTTLNRARKEFSFSCALIENAGLQRTPLSSIQMRRMEFEAIRKIAAILGVTL